MDLPNIYFCVLAVISLLCGTGLLLSRHPITGAVNLVGVMLALAGIYGLLGAPFLGIVQILVYAGAIMMLVVFVIMVLGSARERQRTPSGLMLIPGILVPALLVGTVGAVLHHSRDAVGLHVLQEGELTDAEIARIDPDVGHIDSLAAELFSLHSRDAWFVLFEVIGLVLLVALAGAVLLAKRDLGTRTLPTPPAEEGH